MKYFICSRHLQTSPDTALPAHFPAQAYSFSPPRQASEVQPPALTALNSQHLTNLATLIFFSPKSVPKLVFKVWRCYKMCKRVFEKNAKPLQVEKILAEIRQERCKASPGAECLESDLLELLLVVFQEFPQWLKILRYFKCVEHHDINMTLTWLYLLKWSKKFQAGNRKSTRLPCRPCPLTASARPARPAPKKAQRVRPKNPQHPVDSLPRPRKAGCSPVDPMISRYLSISRWSMMIPGFRVELDDVTCRYMSHVGFLRWPNQS